MDCLSRTQTVVEEDLITFVWVRIGQVFYEKFVEFRVISVSSRYQFLYVPLFVSYAPLYSYIGPPPPRFDKLK